MVENNAEDKAKKKRAYAKDYYRRNKEKVLAKSKEHYARNKEHYSEYIKQWREKNREKILSKKKEYYRKNKERIAKEQRDYYLENREKKLEYAKQYAKEHVEEKRVYQKEYATQHSGTLRTYLRQYDKQRMASDPSYRLARRLRNRVRQAIRLYRKTGAKGGSAVRDLGCSIPELITHLEHLFQPGMSWDNHGSVWHLDHIIPLASFDLTDPEQFKKACHYTNLQPLWATDNIRKGAKLPTKKSS